MKANKQKLSSMTSSEANSTSVMHNMMVGGNQDQSQVYEFKFPIRKEQLCDEPADPNRFWVKTRKNPTNWQED